MARLCRDCGNKINFKDGQKTSYCTGCEKEIDYTDTIDSFTFKSRMAQLKAMHELMCNANDEGIYMSWIYLMPDEPSEDEFEYIAMDDESYNECFDLFVELIKHKGNRY